MENERPNMTLLGRPLRMRPLAVLWLLMALLAGGAIAAEPLNFTAPMLRSGGTCYFSDTLALPASVEIEQLVPRWQLTCGGKPMGALSCGPATRVEG
jgi:hypothetical protein